MAEGGVVHFTVSQTGMDSIPPPETLAICI